jgi:hypothetical protein
MDEASYEGLIGTLYQGAFDDAAWDRGLMSLAALVDDAARPSQSMLCQAVVPHTKRTGGADHRKPGLGAVVRSRPTIIMSGM